MGKGLPRANQDLSKLLFSELTELGFLDAKKETHGFVFDEINFYQTLATRVYKNKGTTYQLRYLTFSDDMTIRFPAHSPFNKSFTASFYSIPDALDLIRKEKEQAAIALNNRGIDPANSALLVLMASSFSSYNFQGRKSFGIERHIDYIYAGIKPQEMLKYDDYSLSADELKEIHALPKEWSEKILKGLN